MDISSVSNKATVQPASPVQRKTPEQVAQRPEQQSGPAPSNQAAAQTPRPVVNTQGQLTGSRLNVTA